MLALGALALAQTSNTGTVIGTVSDPSGGVVAGAAVELVDRSTNQTSAATTNEAGQFSFPSLQPGSYRLTVRHPGFRVQVVENVIVAVAKSYSLDVKLEVGGTSEVITVEATSGAELQTLDSTVGATLRGETLLRLPTINRSAVALLGLQPMVAPTRGVGVNNGGQVAGMRSDQSTFNLDGVDATDLTSGTGGYFASAIDGGGPAPSVPVPLESLEEFRVSTTNPNATFGRSSGGQVNLITKRGTNVLHGSAYWYHQNDNFNANLWELNRIGRRQPELKDNRFGTTLGGPLIRDRLFLFGHYEGRRFPRAASILRNVPTESLKQGILRFRDASGVVREYNVRDFDPRGIGMSPVMRTFWNALPAGNDPAVGDGLNHIGYRDVADNTLRMDFGVARMDYLLNSSWRINSTYRYATQEVQDAGSQLDIAGFVQGNTRGKAAPGGSTPVEPRFFSTQLTGAFSSTLVNELNVGYNRNYWAYKRVNPFPQVPGTTGALMPALAFLDSGLDVDTQRARSRAWRDNTYYISDNLTWIKGKHSLTFGGSYRYIPYFHERDDKVIGSLTSLVYELNAQGAATVPAANRPAACGGGVTANCLQSADAQRWSDLYSASLGIVNKAGVIITRDASLKDQALGTPMRVFGNFKSYEMFVNEVWRVTPSLTITAGLTYGIQSPPYDRDGLQTFIIDAATKEKVTLANYLGRRRAAAEQGRTYNPTLSYLPVKQSGEPSIYSIDWNNIGPRLAAAWNPTFDGGLMGRLFGAKKTVIRAGYGVTYDRVNGVGVVMLPILGVGFSQTITCLAPLRDGSCPGSSDPTNAFRIGVDGSTVRLPTLGQVTAPVTPGINGETLSFSIDPDMKVGRSQAINFTIQRELAGKYIIEIGYAGRYANNLPQNYELNAVPYMMKDSASGQTFAQAFDQVALALRNGNAVVSQPFFEALMRGTTLCPSGNCTQALATRYGADFRLNQLNNLVNGINTIRTSDPLYNRQVRTLFVRGSGGRSTYNAGFISLQRRMSNGFMFAVNYTLSRALDQYGLNQENIGVVSTPYDLDVDYGPALFDRTHALNSQYLYELPFGRGKKFLSSTGRAAEMILGGWYLSGAITASSGFPLVVSQSGQAYGGSQDFGGIGPGALPRNAGSHYDTNINTSGPVGPTGRNAFPDPAAMRANFRDTFISFDGRHGRNVMRGLNRFNWDASLGKKVNITESLRVALSLDAINVLNRLEFNDPAVGFTAGNFGNLTSQFGGARQVQLGLRIEF